MAYLRFLLVLAATVVGLASSLQAKDPSVVAVFRADQERLDAMMSGNVSALARVLSDELVFVHSDGRVESKGDYVKNLLAGDTAYEKAGTADVRTLEPAKGVVILIGAQTMRKRLGGTWSDVSLRFMSVWRNEDGDWRMVAWQSMRPSGSSVVPKK
ncbi:MAG: nuclear transport factor 2 family protein [Opitutaceae bacterium]